MASTNAPYLDLSTIMKNRFLFLFIILVVQAHLLNGQQRLVYSEKGVSFYVEARLAKSWLNTEGERRYYWDVFLTLRNDTELDAQIPRAYAEIPLNCWKINGLTCSESVAQGWLQGIRLPARSTRTFQSCWTSVCDNMTPGWQIGGWYFITNQKTPPTAPPASKPPTGKPNLPTYRYGDPIDRSPKPPTQNDSYQTEKRRKTEEQERAQQQRQMQQEQERQNKSNLFQKYFQAGADYEAEEEFDAALSQYRLAQSNASTNTERQEIQTRIESVLRAKQNYEAAEKANALRRQQEAEQERLERVRQQNIETYQKQVKEMEQKQENYQKIVETVTPPIIDYLLNEASPLKDETEIFYLSGGYDQLLSPLFVSNLPDRATEQVSVFNWHFGTGILKRKGLSSFIDVSSIKQHNSLFQFNAATTSGGRANFSGAFKTEAMAIVLSVGKDIWIAKGHLHLYLGPSIGYLGLFDHVFTYVNATKVPVDFRVDGIKNDNIVGGIRGQIMLFLGNKIALKGGYSFNDFLSKVPADSYYKPTGFSSASVGLAFRIGL